MKQIVKNFNNLIKKTILNVQNKTNIKSKVSNFNKYLITLIGLLFVYLFFLLIPLLYDKDWIQNNIESKIFSEFNINISTSADISYRILPSPHFLIKDSKILIENDKSKKSIADVKNLKVFFSQKNFFDKEKMILTKLNIDNANFSLLRNEIKILNNHNNQLSNKKIKINKSNIFFKDNLNEVITIIKINEAILFFDDEEELNLFNLKGNVFGTSFTIELKNKNDSLTTKEINFKAKSLKLNIFNKSIVENNNINSGSNIISFLNTTIRTKYNIKEKIITFTNDNSRLNNSKINYKGELSINPFDLDLNINLGKYKISKLFTLNTILKEFLKTELLFNENLTLRLSILAETNALDEIFQNAKINFNIVNGKINLDNSTFINNKIGLLQLNKSNLFLKNNALILNTNISVTIKDSKALFSSLNTNKKSRKEIKNILVNLDYNFLNNEIKFNQVKVDNNVIVKDNFLNVMDGFNDNNFNNLTKSRRLLNELLNLYEG